MDNIMGWQSIDGARMVAPTSDEQRPATIPAPRSFGGAPIHVAPRPLPFLQGHMSHKWFETSL